jgi:hypothetical protein
MGLVSSRLKRIKIMGEIKELIIELGKWFFKWFLIYLLVLFILTLSVNIFRNLQKKYDEVLEYIDCHPILVTTNNGSYFEYPCTVKEDNK